MFDTLLGAVTSNSGLIVGGGASAVVLWVLKKVPNEHICIPHSSIHVHEKTIEPHNF